MPKFHFKQRSKIRGNLDIEKAIEKFLDARRLENKSPKTIKTYAQTLGKFADWLGNANSAELNADTIRDYIRYMTEEKEKWSDHPTTQTQGVGVSPRTINNIIRVLRIFFNYLISERVISENPAAGINYQTERNDTFEIFTDEDVVKLLEAPNKKTYTGYRDYVIMLVLIDTGLRIGELTHIKCGDINFQTRQIVIHAENSKMNETRVVPISPKTAKELSELVNYINSRDEDYAFLTQFGERYIADTFAKMLKKYGKKAGIENVRISPHTFRNYMAVKFLKSSGDPFTLMRILGHKDFAMTNRYVKYSNVDVSGQFEKASPVMNLIDSGNNRKRGRLRFM
ncbi:tyrosine-type recombinase/integrase [Neobacillus sp. 179-J 1A1 HS]|uniref:tyrosine-type recombinase/integrase n=1 Tax=Neobacillus driksii TaxID=3035913 RepID=UPI0035BC36F8